MNAVNTAAKTRAARLDADVVVVGAGPVGLLLAGELRLGGADVLVLERLLEPTTESRASTLHARTLEILDARGLLAGFGTLPHDPRGHFGGIPLDLTVPGPYAGQWKAPQTLTEARLASWAADLGVRLLRGHEVRAVEPVEGHVDLVARTPDGTDARVRARYAVAADGQDSTLRGLLGADFPGRPAERELLRADVSGVDVPDRRFERLDRGLAIAARRGDGVTRVMVNEFGAQPSPDRSPGFATVADTWKRVTGEEIGHGTPLWAGSFDDSARQLAGYRHGRVLFAGDAAHRHLPVGGQALNLGLQDAFNLGWKLAAAVRAEAAGAHVFAGTLLDTYHAERHPAGRQVLTSVRAQALLLLGGPEVDPVRAVFEELIDLPPARRHLAGAVSGLDTRYDLGGDHPLTGAPIPHAALRTGAGTTAAVTSSAALLRAGHGVLLDLTGDDVHGERLARAVAPWAGHVRHVRARAAEPDAERLNVVGAALIRPDGHVAWAIGPDATPARALAAARRALRRWFGPPARSPQ
ncbi:oxygenase/bifunctional oxygenase/reductase [Actinacidiphila yanglinensis]|uniref:Oxygenase/bifunctional oxygenase/reductase n=1 Tax=Actinacidiphila yanglinensis TaxID=310779 RepID=A0A1H6DS82_9ACTN|nr:FAD-dependent monooxygenase [Actinacidiphila yanglinensis]SEG87465.1 oxygenase/bifunctional oxygenase/reductase [Actinacidiphila yanglinensis]